MNIRRREEIRDQSRETENIKKNWKTVFRNFLDKNRPELDLAGSWGSEHSIELPESREIP